MNRREMLKLSSYAVASAQASRHDQIEGLIRGSLNLLSYEREVAGPSPRYPSMHIEKRAGERLYFGLQDAYAQ